MLFLLILFVFIKHGSAFTCSTSPQIVTMIESVHVTFDDTIDHEDHYFQVAAQLNSNSTHSTQAFCNQLVISFLNIEPGDRSLPIGSGTACQSSPGQIVVDHSYSESYTYSCCQPLNNSCVENICQYKCPIPPPNLVAPETFYDEIVGWSENIWSTSWSSNSTWTQKSTSFTYYRERGHLLGIFKSIVAIVLAVPLIIGVISLITGKLHVMAASTPSLSFSIHLLTTGTVLVVISYLYGLSLLETNSNNNLIQHNNDRRTLINIGLIYALMTVSYSPLILYTPKPHVQTIHVDRKTMSTIFGMGTCEKIISCLKSKKIRNLCAIIYCLGVVLQIISVYAVYNALREFLGADIQTSCTVAIAYVVLVLVYFIAFITAIYELRPSIRLDRQRGKMTKCYPKSLRNLRKKARHGTIDYRKVAFYNNQNIYDWSQMYLYNGISDFVNITNIKIDDVIEDSSLDICNGAVCILKLHRTETKSKQSNAYLWRVGHVDETGEIVLDTKEEEENNTDTMRDVEMATAGSHRLLEMKKKTHQMENIEHCCRSFHSNSILGTCSGLTKSMTTSDLPRNKSTGASKNSTNFNTETASTDTAAAAAAAASKEGTLSYLKTHTDFQQHCKYGTLYVVSKYDTSTFRFLEVGTIDNGVIKQRNNIVLRWFSYLLHFEDGDAIDPDIEWKPNLVESMRAQGWINFDHCGRCCRGSNCGVWHMLLMSFLSMLWTVMIVVELIKVMQMQVQLQHPSIIGMFTILVGAVELLLVVALSIAGFIASTDINEDDVINGNEKMKLLHDIDETSNDISWVEHPIETAPIITKTSSVEKKTATNTNTAAAAAATTTLESFSTKKSGPGRNFFKRSPKKNSIQRPPCISPDRTTQYTPETNYESPDSNNNSNDSSLLPLQNDFNTRGQTMQSVEFEILNGRSPIHIIGNNGCVSKLQISCLEQGTGYNILFYDFLLSIRQDMIQNHSNCVHLTFNFGQDTSNTSNTSNTLNKSNTSNTSSILPSNIALGMMEKKHAEENVSCTTIGNTSNFANSFGMHSDDGSSLISRKDQNDAWKNTTGCVVRPGAIWWNHNGLMDLARPSTKSNRKNNRKKQSWKMSIGVTNNELFYIVLPNGKTIHLPEINLLLPEWLNRHVEFVPVLSFEYDDDLQMDSRYIHVKVELGKDTLDF